MSHSILMHVLFAVFPLCAIYGAISDIATMTIPNWIVVVMVGAFLVIAPLAGMDLYVFGWHWLAAIAVLVAGFGCFAMGWMGGGDAKFAAAIVLWLGPAATLEFLAFAGLFGGLLTVALLTFRSRLLPVAAMRQEWLMRLHDRRAGVPYGVALAAAALVAYPNSTWLSLAAI